jgi:L-ascorbate metabolism protein UlaG (beta-lactamase superfamily)
LIDAVVISHNHYDHLSHPGVTEIAKLHPNCHFFVPLGNKSWFHSCGIEKVTEMDWWDERDITLSPSNDANAQMEVTGKATTGPAEIRARLGFLPSQHVTARTPFDRFKTLWGSWSIESGGSKVYFTGSVIRDAIETSTGELTSRTVTLATRQSPSFPKARMTMTPSTTILSVPHLNK